MSEKLKLEYFKNENNFQSEIKNIFSFSKLLFFRYEKKKKKIQACPTDGKSERV